MRRIYRRHWLWAAFGLLVMIALMAMVMLSVTAWRLDAMETAARRAAAVEENLRLALWRLDTAWAPLIAQENVRQPADASDLPWVRRAILGRVEWSPRTNLLGGDPLSQPASAVDFASLWQRLPATSSGHVDVGGSLVAVDPRSDLNPSSRGIAEFQQRNQAIIANNAMVQQISSGAGSNAPAPVPPPLVSLWDSGQMLLARRALGRRGEILEVTVLDWQQLREASLSLIADLLPNASLEPVAGLEANRGPDMLATLPVRLIPGPITAVESTGRFSVSLTLAAAWTGVLLAGILGAVLLHGVLQLSERRAAFVTAVTHELRTPLTTFQLYTEMLCSGMVSEDADRQIYLQTLRSEAMRLNHLVDNVLAYARLERGRPVGSIETLTLGEILNRAQPRLEQLACRSDMLLVVEQSEAFAANVQVNVSVVEQILLNLVDNACKYAADATDRRIQIMAARSKRGIELRVRDHGPGLPESVQWLRPFSKSAHQAAESSPGVGLGLALSRRLARQLGGSLRSEAPAKPGACLVLTLPSGSPAPSTA